MKHKIGEFASLFPTPVMITNIGRDFTKDEVDCIANIPMHKDRIKAVSNHRSKDYYLFDNFAEEFKDIKKSCEHYLKQYLEEIEGANTDFAGLRITESWLNKTKPGEYHHLHHHVNSYISGVLYISCLPNDSIKFENRLHGMFNNIKFSMKKVTVWNSIGAVVDVKEGDLVIFPSWIPHYVDINETKNRERISLSFNTFPIGEIGNKYDANHLKL